MRWIVRIVLGLAAFVVAGGVTLLILKPWAPALVVAEPGATAERIDEDGVFGNYFPATDDPPAPGVLLLGGSEGGLGGGVKRMALSLQEAGFAVLQLGYYRNPGQSKNLELVPIETFERGLDWLAERRGVDPARLAIVGASKGAEAGLFVATRRPDVKAVALGAPSSVLWMGINWNFGGSSRKASWSLDGAPAPAVAYGAFDYRVGVLSIYEAGLAERDDRPEAIIPVERVAGPVMLICGEADTLWPSCPMARQIADRARLHGAPEVNVLAYKDAGHANFGVPVPVTHPNFERLAALGGSAQGNAAARLDGWSKLVAFLSEAFAEDAVAANASPAD